MKIDFELILTEKNGKFIAQCPQFPKQKGVGVTEREALENLAKAISTAVESAMGKIMKEVVSSGMSEVQDKILNKLPVTPEDKEDSAKKSDIASEKKPDAKNKSNTSNRRKMILSAQLGQGMNLSGNFVDDLLNFAKQPVENQSSLFNKSPLGANFGLDSKGTHNPKPRPMMPYLIESGMGDGFIIAIPLSSN